MRRKVLQLIVVLLLAGVALQAQTGNSGLQAGVPAATVDGGWNGHLVDHPVSPILAALGRGVEAPLYPSSQLPASQTQPQPPAQSPTQTQAQLPATGAPIKLTVKDAEALALKNNPQISVYRLLSLASGRVTREQKAAYYPNVYGSLTGADARDSASRIAAGVLNNPIVYERAAGGVTLSQLITDFGRTNNLVASAALRAKAADLNAVATADQIKLAVDQAFYNALQSFAEQTVAEQTVRARQLVSDQITTLFQNKLRSQLDVSFADANVAQAKLLLLDAQNGYQASLSTLSQVLGYSSLQQFELADIDTAINPPPEAVSQLVDEAFSNRPEIASQSYEYQAAQRFQKAERDLLLPTIEGLGVIGGTPYSAKIAGVSPFANWYGAVGVNINIPIFNGFLYPARSREASFRAQADAEQLRDLKDKIANDVRTSWLNAITAYNRIAVSRQFVDQTNLAVSLSETRYNLGLSSIVELSQAQLQQTEAQIQYAAAKYQYRIAESTLRFQIAAP